MGENVPVILSNNVTSPELERQILGYAILQREHRSLILTELKDIDFWYSYNQTFFKGQRDLLLQGVDYDDVLLLDYLSALMESGVKKFDIVAYVEVITLNLSPVSKATIEAIIDKLKDKTRRRELYTLANAILDNVDEPLLTADEVASNAENNLRKLSTGRSLETVRKVDPIESVESVLVPRQVGIKTGYHCWDISLNGFNRGEFIVIAGRPSQGKSALMQSVETNISRSGINQAIFSIENVERKVMARRIAQTVKVDSKKIIGNRLDEDEKRKVRTASGIFRNWGQLFIDDTTVKLSQIISKSKALISEHNVEVIYVDYIQSVDFEDTKSSRDVGIGKVTKAFKLLAKEENVAVVGLCALKRLTTIDKKLPRPSMQDLRESGNIEYDADVILFVHRPDPKGDPCKTEIIREKARDGEEGYDNFYYERIYTRFDELADSTVEPAYFGNKQRDYL